MKGQFSSWPHHRFIHGKSHHPIHNAWVRLCGRCYNTKNSRYLDYGGRGIKVCKRWKNSFESFYLDMGEPPRGKSIDRIDNDLHYSCGKCEQCRQNGWVLNCRWATAKQQSKNRRSNRKITYKGETKLITEWADHLKIQRKTLTKRLDQLGWSVKDTLTTPIRKKKIY